MSVTLTYGAVGVFGAFAGWNLVGGVPATPTTKERATAEDSNGNLVASKVFNAKNEYSAEYQCASNTNTIPSTIGKLVGTAILEEISINTTNKGAATMTLTGHNHPVNAHADTLLQAAHEITVSKAFGAVDFLGGSAGVGGDASVMSGSVTISCKAGHVDDEDADGDHLTGQNCGQCTISATTVWKGVPGTNAAAGWDVQSVIPGTTNKGVKTTTITAIKNLTLTAPA